LNIITWESNVVVLLSYLVLLYGSRSSQITYVGFPAKNATRRGSRDSGSNGCIKAGTLFTTPCGTRHQGMHKLRVKDRCLRQKRRSAFIPPLFLSQSRRRERACIIIKCATCIFLNSDYTAESRITFLVFPVDISPRKEIWSFSRWIEIVANKWCL